MKNPKIHHHNNVNGIRLMLEIVLLCFFEMHKRLFLIILTHFWFGSAHQDHHHHHFFVDSIDDR
ncbi:hypothetical protein DERP_003077 [Dermatophagoides pteronyssinus]|uniref:Uncharacterized protein n=1 Tax=Dermatophagoides pteronyssinus TaxID=6956 RepID=A0ABQ8JIG4_DERPT|nr:hypothetical protein DERP_003077 [Dermatophagoides pteronyssinus]